MTLDKALDVAVKALKAYEQLAKSAFANWDARERAAEANEAKAVLERLQRFINDKDSWEGLT